MKLTKREVERLPAPDPSGKQRLYWDGELKGFGVLCSGATTAKSYIVQHRLKNGRTRRVTIAPCGAIDLDGDNGARERAKQVIADFYRGIDPKAAARRAKGAATLQGALDAYLAARKDLRPASVRGYKLAIGRYLEDWLDKPLREIDSAMVEARHREIQREVVARRAAARRAKEDQNPPEGAVVINGHATANSAFVALRTIWNFIADQDPDLPANPVRRLKRQWFQVERRTRVVRSDQLPDFYQAVNALPNRTQRDYLLLLLFTGFRRSDAGPLTWDEVDLQQKVIRLPAKRAKGHKKLDLPMSDYVHDLLVARRALGREGKYVFPADSASGHIEEPRFPLDEIAEKTGIRISAHDLRRTFITVAESTDISPLALKALVNHTLGRDVTAGYVVMATERLREPAQRVCDKLKALCGIESPEGVARIGERR